jgi:YVTN family beta-propeller protein
MSCSPWSSRALWSIVVLNLYLPAACRSADDLDQLKVGVQPDGRIVVPTNQILKPAGRQITFPGRPVDIALAEKNQVLVVKNMRNLIFIDRATGKIRQTLSAAGKTKAGFSVVGLVVDGDQVLVSDAHDHVLVAQRKEDGSYTWLTPLQLTPPAVKGEAHPAGLALLEKERLAVTSTRGNCVQILDRGAGKVVQVIPVGVAPYMVLATAPDRLYVTNWGGDAPKKEDPQAKTSDTPIRIDPRTGVANQGTVSVLVRKEERWQEIKTIPVGLHPSGMTRSKNCKLLYVANANSDTVSVIDTSTDEVIETIRCRPSDRLPFGSGCNAMALSPDGGTLYVANGTNNCLAVIRLGSRSAPVMEGAGKDRPEKSSMMGLIPTGWYPGAVLVDPEGTDLSVVNVKGHGSLSQPRPEAKGKRTYDYLGSVSVIPVPDARQLEVYTQEVNANNRLGYSLAGLDKPRPDTSPVPVPQRHGEPSLFKHVIYIIKENRTYDQVLGDVKEGEGDPNLCIFGEEVTPNHHALARQFTLFDNFYCSGVLSADGHTWVNEAYVSDYLEKAFGAFTRSYPDDGTDPLAYVPTGFLWDNALLHKKTFRNYGEYITSEYEPKTAKWRDLYTDFEKGTRNVKVKAKANIKTLEPYTHLGYPWFPLMMPDVYRAKLFLDEFREFEKKGELPNLIYMTLPCNHTDGTRPGYPTPRAMVADNDLALGRIVEAVSGSQFWKDTCIFVVEDDPQNGFDHIDGHRTVALVISPYTKRKFVDHTSYNQTGMVKTIELLLGLPPMNQLDLSATPMQKCFQDKADLTGYKCLQNRIKLDEMNPSLNSLKGASLHWAKKSLELDLDDGDAADEDTLNRILWHSVRGDKPYPDEFIGRNID